jgi:PEP-CTERM motif
MTKSIGRWGAAIAVFILVVPGSAFADIVQIGTSAISGTGLGAVATVLTIQSNTGSEAGCVGVSGLGALNTVGVCQGSVSGTDTTAINATPSLASLGFTAASQIGELVILFNPGEPAGNAIDLDNLVLALYDASGNALFVSGDFGSAVHFADTDTGTGTSGFPFALDAAQAAAAQAALGGKDLNSVYVGLSAAASDAQGDHETFFVAREPSTPTPVPEPATLLTLGSGLVAAVGWARRRKRS